VRNEGEADPLWTGLSRLFGSKAVSMGKMSMYPVKLVPNFLHPTTLNANMPDVTFVFQIPANMQVMGQNVNIKRAMLENNFKKIIQEGGDPLVEWTIEFTSRPIKEGPYKKHGTIVRWKTKFSDIVEAEKRGFLKCSVMDDNGNWVEFDKPPANTNTNTNTNNNNAAVKSGITITPVRPVADLLAGIKTFPAATIIDDDSNSDNDRPPPGNATDDKGKENEKTLMRISVSGNSSSEEKRKENKKGKRTSLSSADDASSEEKQKEKKKANKDEVKIDLKESHSETDTISSTSSQLVIAEDTIEGQAFPLVGKKPGKGKLPKEEKLQLSGRQKITNQKSRKKTHDDEDVIIIINDEVSESDIADLIVLGFTAEQAKEALIAYSNNKEAAVNYLLTQRESNSNIYIN